MSLGKGNLSGRILALIVSAITIFTGVKMLVTGQGRRPAKGGGSIIYFEQNPIEFSIIVLVALAIGFFILYKTFFERDDE